MDSLKAEVNKLRALTVAQSENISAMLKNAEARIGELVARVANLEANDEMRKAETEQMISYPLQADLLRDMQGFEKPRVHWEVIFSRWSALEISDADVSYF